MDHGTVLFTAAFGFLGQLAKSHPTIPNWIPQTAMLALGLLWYAGNHGLPHTDAHTFVAWFGVVVDWLETAVLAASAIPGTASMIGLIPAMKSRTQTP